MQTSDLQIFLEAVAAESLSAAAKRLNIAPMQVSRRIAALESEIGVRLLHRSTRNISLTPEGAALVPFATSMVETEARAKQQIGPAHGEVTGSLKVSCPTVFGQAVVVPLLQRLLDEHPGLSIELDLSDRVLDIVAHGFDLAIRLATMQDSDLVARKLADNPRVLCASPRYLRRRGKPRICTDLDDHECIMLSTVDRWPMLRDGELVRERVAGRLVTSSVEAARAAALQGLGIAMLTYWDIRKHLDSGELVSVELDDVSMEPLGIWAVMPTRHQVPARVKVFLEALSGALGS